MLKYRLRKDLSLFLCVMCRDIPADEYEKWAIQHDEAKSALVNRSALVDASAEQIERDLLLLGATAIEDKLQQVA